MTGNYDYDDLYRTSAPENAQPPAAVPAYARHYAQPHDNYPPQRPVYAQQAPPRRKRRVFMWVFLAIQVIFIIWLVTGLAGTQASRTQGVTAADRSQAVQTCADGAWKYMSPSDSLSGANTAKSTKDYTSYAACVSDQAKDNAALDRAGSTAGSALGAGIIVVLWVVADILIGGGYAIFRLASRRRYA